MVVQALSALLSPTPPGFSVLRNASHGRGVKATSGDLPSVRTDGRTTIILVLETMFKHQWGEPPLNMCCYVF